MSITLCQLNDLTDPGAREFQLPGDGPEPVRVFLVRRGERVFAYRNACPHTGGPLNWLPDQFLSESGDSIQCATHDARFRIEDGYCIAGPCSGDRLTALPVEIRDGAVCLGAA